MTQTERQRIEEKLRESAERYRAVVETASDAIISIDSTGRIISWNSAAEAIFGWPSEEALEQPVTIVMPERFRSGHQAGLRRAVESGTACGSGAIMEVAGLRRDGSEFPAELSLARWTAKGDPFFTAIIRDATVRRQTTRAMAQQVALIEAMPLLAAIAEGDGRLVMINRAARQMLGIAEDADVGAMNLADLYPEAVQELLHSEWIPDTIKGGDGTIQTVLQGQDEEIPVVQSLVAIATPDDGGRRLALVARDIRWQVHMEEELRQAQKMDAVGQLAGGVAHDFNNALMPIITYSELLLDRLDPQDPLRRYVVQIAQTAESAAHLPRQLLAFSRKQVLQPRVVNLNDIVDGMANMLGHILGEHIGIISRLSPTPHAVKVDPGQIEQVLMNLAVNARDAMPDGGTLTIETTYAELHESYCRLDPNTTAGRYVVLSVSDTGHGMAKEMQARIFEPFFTTKEHGTGLGLSTVYGIVAQSGGKIDVCSEPGQGSTFCVYLPALGMEAQGADAASHAVATGGSETILVVEDEGVVRRGITDVLQEYGYTVLDASDGEDALRVVQTHQGTIHLLLTDVIMPGMGGAALARRLAALDSEMKVVYMTGYTPDVAVRQGIRDEAVAFIQKPFTPSALASKLREVLDAGLVMKPEQ